MVRLTPLLVGLAVLVAGCADSPSKAEPQELGSNTSVTVSATTGGIRGVVVDDAIRPLSGVLITLELGDADRNVTTPDDGTFTFSGLEPGTYFVSAARFGYSSSQQSVEVIANDPEPPVLKMQLLRDATQVAYVSEQQFTGFILCTSSVVAMCGAPNVVSNVLLCPEFNICLGNVTDDTFGFDLYYEPHALFIQSEVVWDSTQPLSTQLSLQMETITGCPDDKYNAYNVVIAGDSPLMNFATADDVEAAAIGGTCSIFHSLFSGDTAGTPLGFTVQQRFDVYSHAFYGFLPPEGWRFSEQAVPIPPQ